MLPPGRAMLVTSLLSTGLETNKNTIGIVVVARKAPISAGCVTATKTSAGDFVSSTALLVKRSYSSDANVCTRVMF